MSRLVGINALTHMRRIRCLGPLRWTTPVGIDLDVVEGRYAQLDEHTVSFETFKQDLDVAPYFRGLPGDACTARTWAM